MHCLRSPSSFAIFLRRLPSRVWCICCMCKVCLFVQRFCNSIWHNIMSHTLPPTHLHAVFASHRSAFRFAYRLESVSALHGSRPSNTRCGPQLRSTSILPSSRHRSVATWSVRGSWSPGVVFRGCARLRGLLGGNSKAVVSCSCLAAIFVVCSLLLPSLFSLLCLSPFR